jgi:antitoxin component of MazEF toxin-antitoxin module
MSRNGFSTRKVWKVGKSLVISFPADWVKRGIVTQGQEFILYYTDEKKIVLLPAITIPRAQLLRGVLNDL